ncbi:helix-turn-helix domain-containing protein [Myroides odoratimimus]|uniref:helix-turn-helix domain-containing protein n=1 Tax=Myroides odoratimimus TaxID=76832 RepID=UPI002096C3BA|nr:helix-turn-helix domain-containing protein [Myroides odoratimimus]MCO7723222.1 helix-turn-helix domain-containing protein [Myroides odoratimimus]MEC4051366.1 helix-turn-helix domain-containing protein [Myroides odoratimimus]
MSTKIIKSFPISYFTQDQSSFFIKPISALGNAYPLLKDSFRANFYMIVFVYRGSYAIKINGVDYVDYQSSVYFIKPGDVVQMQFNTECTGIFIGFEDSFFSQRYHENILRYFDFFQLDSASQQIVSESVRTKVVLLVDMMLGEYSTDRVYRMKVLRSYLNILLCELQSVDEGDQHFSIEYNKAGYNDRILAFMDLVEVHFKEAKTPSFYAEKLCVTPNYLNKLCKQERGITAGQLVRQRIVVEAKRLLQFSTFNVNEIAQELCFDSTSYFVTFFKKQEGITPDHYRKSFS